MSPLYHVNISSQTSLPMSVCGPPRGPVPGPWRPLWGLCMGTGLQGAGRLVWVINDSDRPDLTHSINLVPYTPPAHLPHWHLAASTLPHPASPRHQNRTGAMLSGAQRQHFGLAGSLKLLFVHLMTARFYSKGLTVVSLDWNCQCLIYFCLIFSHNAF